MDLTNEDQLIDSAYLVVKYRETIRMIDKVRDPNPSQDPTHLLLSSTDKDAISIVVQSGFSAIEMKLEKEELLEMLHERATSLARKMQELGLPILEV